MSEITVYGRKACPNCDSLKGLLDDVEHTYVDLEAVESSLAMNMIVESGLRGVPVMQYKDKLYTYEQAVDKLIEEEIV